MVTWVAGVERSEERTKRAPSAFQISAFQISAFQISAFQISAFQLGARLLVPRGARPQPPGALLQPLTEANL